jgi:hypothetical protein
MLKKVYLSVLLFVMSSGIIFCQNQYQDVVYLKNGSIIKGEILEISIERRVKIQTTDQKIWTFNLDEIEKIKREKGGPAFYASEYLYPGFINYSTMGILVGDENSRHRAPFSITLVNSHVFENNLSVGAGFGLEFLDRTSVPLFTDLRYFMNNKKLSPFFLLQSGYSFPIEDEHDEYYQERNNVGGYLINPGIGFLLNFQTGGALICTVGYRNQLLKYEYNDQYDTELKQYYNRFNIRFGLVFR